MKIDLIEGFIDYLIKERHFSPFTARCYSADLSQYVEHLKYLLKEEDLEITEERICSLILNADEQDLRDFLGSLDKFCYSLDTLTLKIATLHIFYKWMKKTSKITGDPVENIHLPQYK